MAFYLTLPSNSSIKYFPNNKAQHFTTQLPQEIDLNGEWEIGLAEIQFTNTYINVGEGDVWLTYTTPSLEYQKQKVPLEINPIKALSGRVIYTRPHTHRMEMRGGVYESNEAFVEELNHQIKDDNVDGFGKKNKHHMSVNYNKRTKIAKLNVAEVDAVVDMSLSLRRILALPSSGHFTGRRHRAGDGVMDLNQGFKSIFVYCDLASPRPAGDVMAPLLRTLPITPHTSATYHQIYNKPHYTPLNRSHFSTVEIVLSTDTGNNLTFTSGHTVVTLHLRPRVLQG